MSKTTKTAARKTSGKAKTTARKANGKKAAAPAKATPAAAKPGTKGEMLVAMLTKGATADALAKELGWLPHTLRASISTQSRKQGFKVERTRTDGVTSYKIA